MTAKTKPKPKIGVGEKGAAIINETASDKLVGVYIRESTLANLADFQSEDEDISSVIEWMMANTNNKNKRLRTAKGYSEVHLKDSIIVQLNNMRQGRHQEYSDVIEIALKREEVTTENMVALEILSNNRAVHDDDITCTLYRILSEREEFRNKLNKQEARYYSAMECVKLLMGML